MQNLNYDKYIKQIEPILKKYDIDKVWVFGSYARGEETNDSDLDLAYERKNKYSMFDELSTMKFINALSNAINDLEIHVTNINNILKSNTNLSKSVKNDLILVYQKGEM